MGECILYDASRIAEVVLITYIGNFIESIIENSISDDYPIAKKEWVYHGEQFECELGEIARCICGHAIRDNRIIRNKLNNKYLIVGNRCINKFEVERKTFNVSKMDYLELGLKMVKTNGARDYLKYDTLPRIKKGEMFNLKDLEVLESVTGKKSRFKAKEHSSGYLTKQHHEKTRQAIELIHQEPLRKRFNRMREQVNRKKCRLFDF